MQQALVTLPELVFAVQPLETPRASWPAEAQDATAAGVAAPFAALIAALEQAAASGELLPPGGNGLPPRPIDLAATATAYAPQPSTVAAPAVLPEPAIVQPAVTADAEARASLIPGSTAETAPALPPMDSAAEAGSQTPAELERMALLEPRAPQHRNVPDELAAEQRTLPPPDSPSAPAGARPAGDATPLERDASAVRPAGVDTPRELPEPQPAPPLTAGERSGSPAAAAAQDAGAAELMAPDGTRVVLGGSADARPQLASAPTSAPAAAAAADDASAAAARTATQDAVTQGIRWMVDHRLGEARLTLNPPELGTVDVKISLIDDQAHVQLVASTAGARDDLEQSLPRLRELLSQGGLELADASVSGGREERRADAARASPFAEPLEPESGDRAVARHTAPASTGIDVYA